jgi:CRP/FNR family cyclic AMP-dependent transcriptional regulator
MYRELRPIGFVCEVCGPLLRVGLLYTEQECLARFYQKGACPVSADVHAILQRLTFTRDLGPADLQGLAEIAKPVSWQAGQAIFREGDRDDFLYLVVEGQAALEINVPPRGRVRILTVGPGEVFGWSSVYYQKPKTAGAAALEATQGLALDAARLRERSETDPRFGYWLARRLLEVVSERLKATRLQLLDVFKS